MAIKGFMTRSERGLDPTPEPTRPTPAEAPAPRTVSPSTSVDASTLLEGTLRCKQTLRIDGRIQGRVECEKSVLVGESAQVDASIDGDEVQVAGGVQGDITAQRKIILQKTAVVKGDLTTPGIVIEEGAKVTGRIVIGTDAEPAEVEPEAATQTRKKKPAARKASGATPPAEEPVPQAAAQAS